MATLSEDTQKALIAELDELTTRAAELRASLDSLLHQHQIYTDPKLNAATKAASQFVAALRQANTELKQGRADWVQECVTEWHHFRLDDEPGVADPVYKSVSYKGGDDEEWEILMHTPTHGRERVILRGCNGVDWTGVYSATLA